MLMRSSLHAKALPVDHPCAACDIRLRTFCKTLDAEELRRFKADGPTVAVAAKQPLFHEGDRADVVFNLTKGSAKLYKLLPDGRRQVTGFLFPGDFLGVTVDDEHAFSAETLEPSELCRFPRHRFETFVEERPGMKRELYRLAMHELAAAQQQMVLLGRKKAHERLASFLFLLLERCGDAAERVALPMNRLDIADYLGLTKETVSRAFTAFKAAGIIRLLPNDVVLILDPLQLESIASGFGPEIVVQ
ncbi:Crp/Fnr family transcriptional regulator [Sphingosinicella sp. LY1275]|uniref:Crp/Fnr family transcriptional regulator n=1 Tax=Sphingosinicella sp. LY1275 TaxID=3095379 RepID=UPI002ADECE02|nr:cyclic nucleotide-binding domain-containing protein [Sphingosinicella sp. LY1275]MEA1015294.1 helix-turn-helix domain-containing protein [Sphingosinicella sp. LY1275]